MNNYPKYSKGIFINILDSDLSELEDAVAFADSLEGLQHIEIWLENPPKTKGRISQLSRALTKYKLIVHAPFIHQSLMSHLDEVNDLSINLLKRSLEVSNILDAKVFTVHGGAYPTFLGSEAAFDLLQKNLQRIMATSVGSCPISIENLPERGGATTNYPTSIKH